MIRVLFIIFVLKSILLGCSLCSVYIPKVDISTNIELNDEYIKSLKVNWDFEKEFTNELLQLYDLNSDKKFDEKELKLIEEALLSYLLPRNFITKIYYDNKLDTNELSFEVKDYKMSFKNSILKFEYSAVLDLKIYNENILRIKIFDNEGYFFTIFKENKQIFKSPYNLKKSTNINEVSYFIDAFSLEKQKFNIDFVKNNSLIEDKNLYETWTKNSEVLQEKSSEDILKNTQIKNDKNIENLNNKFVQYIKKYLVDIQNKEDNFSLFFLILASFLYGVVHSIGPGHGKAFAFSYFSSFRSSYFEAFLISLATAFIHIIGAFILVIFSIFILQNILNNFIENSVSYITSFSAIVIMFLAIYILYRKINKKTNSCCSCSVELKSTIFSTKPKQRVDFVKTSINNSAIIKPRSKKQDLIFVLSAGIIPCPGTVLLFIYAFLLETYFAVVLATISISFGMALVIFASSFFGVSVHKVSQKSKKMVNILEIASPIFMFILAFLLLFTTII